MASSQTTRLGALTLTGLLTAAAATVTTLTLTTGNVTTLNATTVESTTVSGSLVNGNGADQKNEIVCVGTGGVLGVCRDNDAADCGCLPM